MRIRVRPLYANVYFLDTPAGRLVVDSGVQPLSAEFALLLRRFRPQALVVTHAHIDHAGGAWVAAHLGIPVLAHPAEHAALSGQVHELPYPAGQPRWGRLLSRAHLKVPQASLHAAHPGETVLGWEVVALPGHTAGQVGLRRDGVLLAADAVVSGPAGAHLPRAAYNSDHAQALDTLRRVADMDLRAVLPGHGAALRPEQLRERLARDGA